MSSMPFDFDTLTRVIQSPPGVVVAGVLLLGTVWGFFERVESVLNDEMKKGIAGWLLDAKAEPKFKQWSDTVLSIFFFVCGTEMSLIPSSGAMLSQRTRASALMGVACWMPCTLPVVADLYIKDSSVFCPYTVYALLAALGACLVMAFLSLGYCNVLKHNVAAPKYFFLWAVTSVLIVGFGVPVLAFRIIMYGHFINGIASTDTLARCISRWWLSALFQ